MIVRRLLILCSFSLTAAALIALATGALGGLLAIFFVAPAGLLALIVVSILVSSPPTAVKRRMWEAQIAFGASTAVLLLAGIHLSLT